MKHDQAAHLLGSSILQEPRQALKIDDTCKGEIDLLQTDSGSASPRIWPNATLQASRRRILRLVMLAVFYSVETWEVFEIPAIRPVFLEEKDGLNHSSFIFHVR